MKTKKDKNNAKKNEQQAQITTPPLVTEMTDDDLKQVVGGNRVNETVTNLSKSQSDAQKSVTQNLSV